MSYTGITLAICYVVVRFIRAAIDDNAAVPTTVTDVILGALAVAAVHFIGDRLCYGIRFRRHLPRGLAAAAAAVFTRAVQPRLKVTTMVGSQMTTTVIVPHSHAFEQTVQFVSEEPKLKVTMKLPHGGRLTMVQPRLQPFVQTVGVEGRL